MSPSGGERGDRPGAAELPHQGPHQGGGKKQEPLEGGAGGALQVGEEK